MTPVDLILHLAILSVTAGTLIILIKIVQGAKQIIRQFTGLEA